MNTSFIFPSKFYQYENSFKNFKDLSEEQLSTISKKVYRAQEGMISNLPNSYKKISNFELYQNTLKYLTNPKIYFDLKTYDERIAYLIMMIDPNLVTFKEFLKLNFISIKEIDKIKNKNEKNHLIEIRKETIAKYECTVRNKIGFFDIKLLKYEELFFKKFFNKKELITEIGLNSLDNFMLKAPTLKDFNSISQKRYEELVVTAQTWLFKVKEKHNYKIAAYSVINQYKLLGLNNTKEQFLLLILLIDNNLDMLRIYEEESQTKNIEKRIIEEFGYYNKELLVLEKKLHNRFCPEKELSIWSKTKKR